MTQPILWGSSERQFGSLPPEVQDAFEWAIDELVKDPTSLPRSETRLLVETGPMSGSLELRRIKVKRRPEDPGYRGIYLVDTKGLVFLRFAFRDKATYRGLKAMAQRARAQLGLD